MNNRNISQSNVSNTNLLNILSGKCWKVNTHFKGVICLIYEASYTRPGRNVDCRFRFWDFIFSLGFSCEVFGKLLLFYLIFSFSLKKSASLFYFLVLYIYILQLFNLNILMFSIFLFNFSNFLSPFLFFLYFVNFLVLNIFVNVFFSLFDFCCPPTLFLHQ